MAYECRKKEKKNQIITRTQFKLRFSSSGGIVQIFYLILDLFNSHKITAHSTILLFTLYFPHLLHNSLNYNKYI